jgi:hypothetical protein
MLKARVVHLQLHDKIKIAFVHFMIVGLQIIFTEQKQI